MAKLVYEIRLIKIYGFITHEFNSNIFCKPYCDEKHFLSQLKNSFDHFLYQNASRDTPQSGQNCQKKPYKNKFHTIHCPENFTQCRTSHEKVI